MTGSALLLLVVLWFALAWLAMNQAQAKGYSTAPFAIMSVVLTPLLACLVVYFAPDKRSRNDERPPEQSEGRIDGRLL